MIQRFEKFSLAISEISRCWHKIATEEMEKYGLKGIHSIYLTTLLRFPEGITAAKLCEYCGRDKAEVSRTVSVMEEKGLLQKQGSAYRSALKLTPAGVKAAEYVRNRAALAVELAGADLSPEQRSIFYNALASITQNLQTISQTGLPENKEQL